MFKNFVITLLAAVIALTVANTISAHVEKVEGLAQIKCVASQCYEIGDSVYLIKN